MWREDERYEEAGLGASMREVWGKKYQKRNIGGGEGEVEGRRIERGRIV